MHKQYKVTPKGNTWHIMARKGAGIATEAAWVSLGGCTSQIIAMRVYLALQSREVR